ncbi:MAG: FtsX-like permease family protein [Candidatus Helarchaeales archaeon]
MATLRVIWKSFKIAYRSKRRFIVAVFLYAALIITASYILNYANLEIFNPNANAMEILGLIGTATIIILGTLVSSMIYGFLISYYRKQEIATLRTIGWDKGSLRWFFLSELILVFVVAFLLVIEVMIHVLGFTQYASALFHFQIIGLDLVAINPIILVLIFIIVLGCQIIAILLGYWRMLKIRPMEAMRKA